MDDLSATAAIQSHGIANVAEPTLIDERDVPRHVRSFDQRPRDVLGRARQADRLDQALHARQEHLLRHPDVSIKWFEDGTLNVSANCIDRHLKKRGDQVAIIWEGDDPSAEARHITYRELYREVNLFANVLKSMGVSSGDRVTIYLPMIPEAAYAMLACARIGAVHSVVFGGFSPEFARRPHRRLPLEAGHHRRRRAARRQDGPAQAQHRRGAGQVARRREGDRHPAHRRIMRHACRARLLVPRARRQVSAPTARPRRWAPRIRSSSSTPRARPASRRACCTPPAAISSMPRMTHQLVFDYHDGDVYWCTADVGWVTGHSYIVYGPLANGAHHADVRGRAQLSRRQPLLAGGRQAQGQHLLHRADRHPGADGRRRRLRDAHEPEVASSCSARVGEPINPEAWEWYYRVVGEERCPIVDTWWQTETGGIMITPLPGATELKPGSATLPFFGVQPAVVDAEGNVLEGDGVGQPRHHRRLARPDAHRLWRPSALRRHLLHDLSRQLLHRRRLPARRGRLLLDHRPRRRRDQRLRPPHRHGGGRSRRWSPIPRSSEAAVVGYPHDHQGPGHLLPM